MVTAAVLFLSLYKNNQATIRLLHEPPKQKTSPVPSAECLRQKARRIINEDSSIALHWALGYEGIELNEEAGTLAKKAAEDQVDAHQSLRKSHAAAKFFSSGQEISPVKD
ncbi:hypothetical protein CROQUDRAFT_105736 [Cronartium quercuum f. sp. fusiforme G11]|uniref:Uncharacterized protein n=1 Tax=Cronartium quercuum f. sp. fusiforme G11 TaxID=708437 RepID=A0A9P6TF82_9BASI|nr:hypothetical protein CROQUDRAFT_105736 [Cronartium quercuum f. sp. fusiforme G11]